MRFDSLRSGLKFTCLGIAFSIAQSFVHAQDTAGNPSWIWVDGRSDSGPAERVVVRREFQIDGEIKRAAVAATADNHCEVIINGTKLAASDDWSQLATADAKSSLRQGMNVISISARNDGGPAGLIASLMIEQTSGTKQTVSTDASWKGTIDAKGEWESAGFDDKGWVAATVLGELGDAKLPWSGSLNKDSFVFDAMNSTPGEYMPKIADNAHVPDGFKIEKIFQVPKSMGSWVSLTTDDRGRLFACDQDGAGLFMITPGNATTPTKVESVPVKISSIQGLLWAFNSLYAVVNGGSESGLHRLTDTDGDGRVDADEFCMPINGGGEHGPHAVILSPDGKSIYIASGNHTKLPDAIAGSRIPRNWNEDHLLPRRWDANGHAAGILAPGGWICNVDPRGKKWDVFSIGYRNQYDIAFNQDGELFTFDADMEWDFGSPWYRPTRVCHATSGSEFGWRSGTGKWPTYYEDSLPPAVEIGPGSPTGIAFGTGAKFPAKYQKSLFILDWTYSTIYSVEMTPDGASYRGEKADFVTGTPLPVTDAVVGTDGAFYFAVGGRGTQSALFRVTYVGQESTVAVSGKDQVGSSLRELRHRLEAFHGRTNGDLELILKNLSHEDRFIRYAARVALESQPIETWRAKAFAAKDPKLVINAMIAVARQGDASDLDKLLASLMQLDFKSLNESDQLAYLRAFELAFIRQGEPSEAWRTKLISHFDSLYPASSYPLNAELVQLQVYLNSPTVVGKTLALMDTLGPEPIPNWNDVIARNAGYGGTVGNMLANMPPVRGIHFAFVLRNAKTGWTLMNRKKYFEFFIEAAKHPGGNSFAKFLTQFREDALTTCSPAEQIVLEPITSVSLVEAPVPSTPPQGPGRLWKTTEALATLGSELSHRNFDKGRNLYHAVSCSKCHRLGGAGGGIGPDLSTAAKKFSLQDMLDAITEPSKAISDQYGSQQVITDDGKVLIGRTVEIGDEYYVYTADASAKPVVLNKSEVDQVLPSKVSQMPTGLIDALNEEELKDLIAYLMASGDPGAKFFK